MKRNVNLPERIDCLISEFSCFKIGYTQNTHTSHDMKQIIFLRYKNN